MRQIGELKATFVVAERVDEQLVVGPLNLRPSNGRIRRRVEHTPDDGAVAGLLRAASAARLRVSRIDDEHREARIDERGN